MSHRRCCCAVGACCHPANHPQGLACVNSTEQECLALAGTFRPGFRCEDRAPTSFGPCAGACCTDLGNCVMCPAVGHDPGYVFQGYDTRCPDVPCEPGYSCRVPTCVPPATCCNEPGQYRRGCFSADTGSGVVVRTRVEAWGTLYGWSASQQRCVSAGVDTATPWDITEQYFGTHCDLNAVGRVDILHRDGGEVVVSARIFAGMLYALVGSGVDAQYQPQLYSSLGEPSPIWTSCAGGYAEFFAAETVHPDYRCPNVYSPYYINVTVKLWVSISPASPCGLMASRPRRVLVPGADFDAGGGIDRAIRTSRRAGGCGDCGHGPLTGGGVIG